MSSEERRQRLNFSFLKQCVERRPMVPIQQECLDSILSRVPLHLRQGPGRQELVDLLCQEVREEFRSSMVQHTVMEMSRLWHDSFVRNRKKIGENLHILQPVMRTILDLCHTTFSGLLLIDFSNCRSKGPAECENLRNKMVVECERMEDKLLNTWFPKIIHLLTSKELQQSIKPEKLDSLYNCASTLISNQLRDLVTRSVQDFVSLFQPERALELPLFRMDLIFDHEKMEFYPTFEDLELAVLDMMIQISNTMQNVQTVQSWLAEGQKSCVDAKVADHVLTWAQTSLRSAVRRGLEGPGQHFQSYAERYDWLVDGRAEARVQTFVGEEHSFDEYIELEEEFRNLSREIMSQPTVAHFPMVRLDCEELKQGLAKKAMTFSEILLEQLVIRQRRDNLQLCKEFETIRDKVLRVPETTEEMTALVAFITHSRTKGMEGLQVQLLEMHRRLNILLDLHIFEPEDLDLNSTVLLWPRNMLPIFDEGDEVVLSAKSKGEEELLMRRDRLAFELEKLGHRLEEFAECSELEMMPQYVADVKGVQKRIQEAEEAIGFINKEEKLYEWDLTSYPVLDTIKENVDPYHKLFGLVLKWQRTEKKWMDGSFQDLNGETMEVEVDEFFREVYKMLKSFKQKQKKAEQEARLPPGSTTEDSPSVQICSKRHWTEMSGIVGYDLTPDSGTTLRKLLKQNLFSYLEQFEAISVAASKEFSLEKAMQTMVEIWDDVAFNYNPYRETGVSILSSVDEIQTMLDDQIVKTQTMRGSPFIKPFEAQIRVWEERLIRIQDTIDEWLKVQAQWLYLEPIFSSEDIMQQMPEEGRLFQTVLPATSLPGLLEKLQDSNDLLDKIMKGLNAYLEKKRLFFP
ncbi:hypothetical protein JZ751_005606, partial [Albula glossodonta]